MKIALHESGYITVFMAVIKTSGGSFYRRFEFSDEIHTKPFKNENFEDSYLAWSFDGTSAISLWQHGSQIYFATFI